jgi:glycosyltransferase involved in cell wall biosynthesis
MRIFMLVQHPEARGPVPKHTAHLVSALRSLGCDVVTHPWGQHAAGESLRQKLLERPRDVLSVYRAVRRQPFDVCVVKTSHDWRTLLRDIPVALALRRRGRPIVLQLHGSLASTLDGPGAWALKLATRLLLALVDGVMVLSTEEQRQWQAFRRLPPVFVVKNPYLPAPEAPPRGAEVDGRSPRVLFVGRLIEAKGVFALVDALSQSPPQLRWDLVVVGEGDEEAELRERVRSLGLGDRVTLTGYLTGSALTDRYRDATVFALPTTWDEGFPTVLAEAMDAGLPIVTTRIRGAADYLEAGENALFVAPRDVGALVEAIRNLLVDGDLRARMGTDNRRRIEMFAPPVVAAEYLDVLRSVVGSANDRGRATATAR